MYLSRLTTASSGLPNLFEQMQLLNAAQMMSSGLGATGNTISGPPLNALAAALNQPSASAGAPPLTPNGTAALFGGSTNYNSPSKVFCVCSLFFSPSFSC